MWVLVALVPPLGHAVWALARSAGEADGASPLQIALAAALLELALFFGLVAAVVAAARMRGTRPSLLHVVRSIAWAQAPAALYFLGLLPPITHFMPLLPLVLAVRSVTSIRAAMVAARLPLLLAVIAVLAGAALGVLVGFATAAAIYS